MSDDHRLDRPAADYLAGDLEPDERAAFEAAREGDPELAEELAFWQRMGPALRDHGRPPGARLPGPGMLAVVRRRAAEQEALGRAAGPQRLNLIAWTGWALAAAAAILLAVNLLDRPAPPPSTGVVLAYAEDGSAQVLPESVAELSLARHQPEDDLALDRPETEDRRPWLGVWTRPIELKGFERPRGLRVERVAIGSPAHAAGLAPGDILLDFAGCAMATRYCIAHALREARLSPGDTAELRFWQRSSGEVQVRQLALGGCLE